MTIHRTTGEAPLWPLAAAALLTAATFLVSWIVEFALVSSDWEIDVDLGVAPATMPLGGRLFWAGLGAIVPTACVALGCVVGLFVWRLVRRS